MADQPAPWRDRARLEPLLAAWLERAAGRAMHHAMTGGDWMHLQLAGPDRVSFILAALPGAVLAFPLAGPLPPALRAALVPQRRNPLGDLLAEAVLTDARLLADDLVLHLAFTTPDGPRLVRHQLFGSRGGLVVLDGEGRMLWTAHPGPHPCLLDVRAPLATPGAPHGGVDPAEWTSTGLERLARQQETALADRLQRRLDRAHAAAARLVENLTADLARADDGQERRRDAEALAAHLHAVPRGAATFTCADPRDGRPRTVALDGSASAATNLDRLFHLARKAERGRQVIAERLAAAEDALARHEAALAGLASTLAAPDEAADGALEATLVRLASLQEFAATLPDTPQASRPAASGRAADEPARPFRRFLIAGRWEVWVGRSAQENDVLTHRAAHPRDLWLHAQGVEGSHVVLRTAGRPDLVPRAVIAQAASIAAAFSKARHSALVPVMWTERRYVRRPRRAAPGTAVCQRAESVMVEPGITAGVEPA